MELILIAALNGGCAATPHAESRGECIATKKNIEFGRNNTIVRNITPHLLTILFIYWKEPDPGRWRNTLSARKSDFYWRN